MSARAAAGPPRRAPRLRRPVGARGHRPDCRTGRGDGAGRSVRLRQIDTARHHGRAARARRRRSPLRGRGRGRLPQCVHLRVPGFRAAAVAHGRRQHRAGAGGSSAARRTHRACRRGAGADRACRLRRCVAAATFGRHAPARRHRARARGAAGVPADGRAAVGAGCADAWTAAGRVRGADRARPHHHDLCHAQSRRGGAAGSADRRAVAPAGARARDPAHRSPSRGTCGGRSRSPGDRGGAMAPNPRRCRRGRARHRGYAKIAAARDPVHSGTAGGYGLMQHHAR